MCNRTVSRSQRHFPRQRGHGSVQRQSPDALRRILHPERPHGDTQPAQSCQRTHRGGGKTPAVGAGTTGCTRHPPRTGDFIDLWHRVLPLSSDASGFDCGGAGGQGVSAGNRLCGRLSRHLRARFAPQADALSVACGRDGSGASSGRRRGRAAAGADPGSAGPRSASFERSRGGGGGGGVRGRPASANARVPPLGLRRARRRGQRRDEGRGADQRFGGRGCGRPRRPGAGFDDAERCARVVDPVKALEEQAEGEAHVAALALAEENLARLTVRCGLAGRLIAAVTDSQIGRYFREGDPLGVVAGGPWVVRAILTEEEIALAGGASGSRGDIPGGDDARTGNCRATGADRADRIAIGGAGVVDAPWRRDIAVDPQTGEANRPYFELVVELPVSTSSFFGMG